MWLRWVTGSPGRRQMRRPGGPAGRPGWSRWWWWAERSRWGGCSLSDRVKHRNQHKSSGRCCGSAHFLCLFSRGSVKISFFCLSHILVHILTLYFLNFFNFNLIPWTLIDSLLYFFVSFSSQNISCKFISFASYNVMHSFPSIHFFCAHCLVFFSPLNCLLKCWRICVWSLLFVGSSSRFHFPLHNPLHLLLRRGFKFDRLENRGGRGAFFRSWGISTRLARVCKFVC